MADDDATTVYEMSEPRYAAHRSRDAVMPILTVAILKDGAEVGHASIRLTHAVGLDGVPDLAVDFRYTICGTRPEPEIGFREDMTLRAEREARARWITEGAL